MATVNFKFFRAEIVGGVTAVFGVDAAPPETKTSSGTSQSTTFAAQNDETFVRIVSSGGNVWVTFGESPTAVSGTGTLILDEYPDIFKLRKGDKIAVID